MACIVEPKRRVSRSSWAVSLGRLASLLRTTCLQQQHVSQTTPRRACKKRQQVGRCITADALWASTGTIHTKHSGRHSTGPISGISTSAASQRDEPTTAVSIESSPGGAAQMHHDSLLTPVWPSWAELRRHARWGMPNANRLLPRITTPDADNTCRRHLRAATRV